MKKIQICFSIMVALLFASCGQKNAIEANIGNIGNDTILVSWIPLSEYVQADDYYHDTIVAQNNIFFYNPTATEPVLINFIPKKGEIQYKSGQKSAPMSNVMIIVWQPKDKLTISGTLGENYLDYTVVGNEISEHYSLTRQKSIMNLKNATLIEMQIDSLSIQSAENEQIEALYNLRSAEYDVIRTNQWEYIKNNLNKDLAAYLVLSQPSDTFTLYYEKMDEKVKSGMFKPMLDNRLSRIEKYNQVQENKAKAAVGMPAPDFTLKSISGEDFTLSSIQDKYIVLDFWGSWCPWCIKAFPRMKEYYAKYKDKIEFVGIACRDSEEKWKKAVAENELPWKHVLNGTDNKNDMSVAYAVDGYPTLILLDKDKKIVEVFVGESEDFYKKLDEVARK